MKSIHHLLLLYYAIRQKRWLGGWKKGSKRKIRNPSESHTDPVFRAVVKKQAPLSLVYIIVGKMNLRQLGTHSLLNELRQDIQRIVRQQIVLQPEERKVWVETEGKVRVEHGQSLVGQQFAIQADRRHIVVGRMGVVAERQCILNAHF